MQQELEKKEQDLPKTVQLGNKVVGELDFPTLNTQEFIGKKVKIDNVREMKGQHGFYILVETEIVATLADKPIRASRIFGLHTVKDDLGNIEKIGWAKNSQLAAFLKKMEANHYNELEGKEVIIQTKTNKNDGRDYLSFN